MPKILIDELPVRTPVREPQLAEQLGGSTDDHLLFLIAADCGVERGTFQFRVVMCAVFKVFSPGQGSTTLPSSLERISVRNVEQIVDIPLVGGGLQGFRPGQSSSSSSHRPAGISEDTDEPGVLVFRTFFPREKSARAAASPSAELLRKVSSWTPAAYEAPCVGCGGDALQRSVPGQSSAAPLGGPLPGQSSARGVRLSDAAARWQAQDPRSEFWPKRACRFLLQGGCQQGQACTSAHSVHRLHPDAPWEEFMKLFRVGEQDARCGVW